MKDYEQIKSGTKVNVSVIHYAPNYKSDIKHDVNKIWVTLSIPNSESEYGGTIGAGSGYIANPYPADFFGSPEFFRKTSIEGVITSVKFQERANGGRTNTNEYDSIEAYLADPMVKRLVEKKTVSLGIFNMQAGDPDKVDVVINFRLSEFPASNFEVKETIWEDIIPQAWYDEIFFEEGVRLNGFPVYDNVLVAIDTTIVQDDLFGNRLFPVIRFPKDQLKKFIDHASCFKNHSKPIISGEYGFIGLRSKPDEIWHLEEVYKDGGRVLIGKEWNWT